MSCATRFARSRGSLALATAATLALTLAAPSLALAQNAQPKAPRPAPAQPAPQAQPQSQAAQPAPAAPTVVQLKAEPAQTDWTKMCGKDQAGGGFDICITTRDFVSDQNQPVLAVAVYDVKGGPQAGKIMRLMMPLALLLQPGVRVAVDQGQPTPGRYVLCMPNGCLAEVPVKDDVVNALKKGNLLNVSAQSSQGGREVTFAIPAAGFGKAFDGQPIDPKVLEEQQKKLQEELEKRSQELRQRMEQQSSGGAAPSPSAAATPPTQRK